VIEDLIVRCPSLLEAKIATQTEELVSDSEFIEYVGSPAKKKKVNKTDNPCVQSSSCDWVGALKTAQLHHKSCLYRQKVCKNAGCVFQTTLKSFPLHEQVCPFRLIPCEHCLQLQKLVSLENHKQNCPNRPVQCPNGCKVDEEMSAVTVVPANKVQAHKDVCELEPVACPFLFSGCKAILARKDIKCHVDATNFLSGHLFGMMQTVEKLQKDTQQHLTEIDKLKKENALLKTEIESIMSMEFIIEVPDCPDAQWEWKSSTFQFPKIGKPAFIHLQNDYDENEDDEEDADSHGLFLRINELEESDSYVVNAAFVLHTNDQSRPLTLTLNKTKYTKEDDGWGQTFVKTACLSSPKYRNSDGNIRISFSAQKISITG